ncbi:SDR family NAD(P)-dependent oxidoreductase [Sphingomonas sp. MMS24-JH45]
MPQGLSAYSATKFAVRGLTEALDAESAADGIRVRDLMPGFIDTPLLSAPVTGSNRTAREAVAEAGMEFTPVRRWRTWPGPRCRATRFTPSSARPRSASPSPHGGCRDGLRKMMRQRVMA